MIAPRTLLERDPAAAQKARYATANSLDLLDFPFTCRKAATDNPPLREMLISFGSAGYVARFEITDKETVTAPAVRHQREDDYH